MIGKRIEIAGVRKDGSEILVELAITALKIDSAPIFTAYLRDITEGTRNEEASRRLGAIIESSDDAIVSKDLNGIITSWNGGAEKLFGFSAEEAINKPERRRVERELELMRQAAAMLLAHARRNDQLGEFFANGLGPTKTKNALGGRIKLEDAAVCAHGNDAIERGIANAAIQHFEVVARDSFAVFGPSVWISSEARLKRRPFA